MSKRRQSRLKSIWMKARNRKANGCARDAAQGLVFGSPFRSEIERRDPSVLDRAVEAVAQALLRWDGQDAPISAHLVTARTLGAA